MAGSRQRHSDPPINGRERRTLLRPLPRGQRSATTERGPPINVGRRFETHSERPRWPRRSGALKEASPRPETAASRLSVVGERSARLNDASSFRKKVCKSACPQGCLVGLRGESGERSPSTGSNGADFVGDAAGPGGFPLWPAPSQRLTEEELQYPIPGFWDS